MSLPSNPSPTPQGVPCPHNDFELIHQARLFADELLSGLIREPVTKSMNLRSKTGMAQAVAQMANSLRSKGRSFETAAVREAVRALDVDWRKTTAQQRHDLIERAKAAVMGQVAQVPKAQAVVYGNAAQQVVAAARDGVRKDQKLNISAKFNTLDERIVQYLKTSESNLVKDEYGRRNEAFGQEAGHIVAEGLEAGLGRQDITERLSRAADDVLINRPEFYWEVVASSFISRGRSFAQLSSYAEAGIERYIIEATLDENTTDCCRFLHGKSFTVSSGLQKFQQLEENPDQIKAISPWLRESVDKESGRKVIYVKQGEKHQIVAEVTRSAMGTSDDVGEFARGSTEQDLLGMGISFPPFHGLCRSVAIADVSAR